jgi:steroid delta-isomerase-like uncharacterized protein
MVMRKTTCGALLLTVLISACGGEGDAVPPPQVPPPPPPTATAPPPAPVAPPTPPEPPKPALIELQKQNHAAAVAALNAHDSKKFSEIFAPDAVVNVIGMGPEIKGREAIAGEIQKNFDAFPDFKIAITKVFVKNDVAVQEWVVTGTNKGEFNGMKPTNKAIGLHGAAVLWFTPDGLVKQEDRYFDGSTMMAQLGQMKMPARPVATLPSGDTQWHVAKGTPEEDKLVDVAKGMYGSFEKKSESDFLGALADNPTWSDVGQPKDMSGKAEAKKFFGMYTKAFTDMKSSFEVLFAADEYVVSESTMTAVHSGQLGPLKPTKKPVTLHGIDIMVIKDGKIQSGTSYANSMELLGQEGLLPKPKAAKTEGDKKAEGDKKGGGEKKAEGEKKEGDKKPADKDKPKDAKGGDKDKDKDKK